MPQVQPRRKASYINRDDRDCASHRIYAGPKRSRPAETQAIPRNHSQRGTYQDRTNAAFGPPARARGEKTAHRQNRHPDQASTGTSAPPAMWPRSRSSRFPSHGSAIPQDQGTRLRPLRIRPQSHHCASLPGATSIRLENPPKPVPADRSA